MRVERVTARAFGPFSGESLDLAPGLTVVSGPNEAGKSTWHAAIRAGICGVRRGRGAGTKVEAAFEERHRPWDGDGRWEVEVRLALDDGRTIDVSQDLAGKVACRATDIVLGRDVSDEILDGTPDASRWLGLDRDAFAATICVGQAQIASIAGRDTAASLQEHMQRAAATRGTDATAAEARERLQEFRREQVGVDRQNARGPLRSARVRAEAARAALATARAQHDAYLDATARAEAAERVAATLGRRTAAAEAALAAQSARELARRAGRAAELAARHPVEPAGPAARDALADRVAGALDAFASRPRVEPLDGPTAAQLEAELASLPAAPEGDTAVHPDVLEARRAVDRADEALGLLGARPAPPAGDASHDPELLRSIARRLRIPEPQPAPELEAAVQAAEAGLATRDGGGARTLGTVGAVLAAIGAVGSMAIGLPVVAIAALLVAAGLAGWAWLDGRGTADAARRSLDAAHAALAPIIAARDHARSERHAAAEEARAAGLPDDPDHLDRLVAASEAAARAGRDALEWQARRAALEARRAAALEALSVALRGRGAAVGDDPITAFTEHEAACRRRAEQAAQAGARAALERALASRRAAESAGAEAARGVERAIAAVRQAAAAVGLADDGPPESVAAALEAWRRQRGADVQRADAARREWHELLTVLDGRSLDALRADAEGAAARAATLAARVEPAQLAEMAQRPDLASLLEVEREELELARSDANVQRGALAEIGRELPDVAEAEEALAEAVAELERVEGLSQVIDATLELLRAAEERVHRDLAPILADGIGRWLPRISDGAYTDASVDPADLSVRVKEAASGRWRPALLLSEGTREQIYLLLRATMAQQLATTGETAPLMLDEPTAQADADRKRRLLEVLHELSAERQIILFTHDDDVIDWAAGALVDGRDRLVRLGASAVATRAAVG